VRCQPGRLPERVLSSSVEWEELSPGRAEEIRAYEESRHGGRGHGRLAMIQRYGHGGRRGHGDGRHHRAATHHSGLAERALRGGSVMWSCWGRRVWPRLVVVVGHGFHGRVTHIHEAAERPGRMRLGDGERQDGGESNEASTKSSHI
jgi:hypothetical protein